MSTAFPLFLLFYSLHVEILFLYIFKGIGHIFLLNDCYVGSSCTWYSETLFVPGDSFSQHILVYTHTCQILGCFILCCISLLRISL